MIPPATSSVCTRCACISSSTSCAATEKLIHKRFQVPPRSGVQSSIVYIFYYISRFIRCQYFFLILFDFSVDIEKDANICRLCSYARVEWIWNYGNLLNAKDSPVDRGKEIFDKLYKERRRLSFSHTIR